MIKNNIKVRHAGWCIVLLIVFQGEVEGTANINQTDVDMDLESCYKASLDPMYYKHPDKYLKAVKKEKTIRYIFLSVLDLV